MVLSEIDRNLLDRCLGHKPRSWEDFADRFLGLVVHVINHTAQCRSTRLTNEDREDLAAEVFLTIVQDEYKVLRHFQGNSSLATYLTVVARRVVVRELMRRKGPSTLSDGAENNIPDETGNHPIDRISNREEVERLVNGLESPEAEVVRMYHLDGLSYREISLKVGMAENSIGPALTRARDKMRQMGS